MPVDPRFCIRRRLLRLDFVVRWLTACSVGRYLICVIECICKIFMCVYVFSEPAGEENSEKMRQKERSRISFEKIRVRTLFRYNGYMSLCLIYCV